MSFLEEIFERYKNAPWYKKLWWKTRRVLRFKAHFNHLRWRIRNTKGRITKGYGPMDLWSFDSYLARVISEGCRDFAKLGNSYPSDLTPEKWAAILNEIADGFEICYKHWDMPYDTWPNGDYMQDPKVKRAFKLFRQYFSGLWD